MQIFHLFTFRSSIFGYILAYFAKHCALLKVIIEAAPFLGNKLSSVVETTHAWVWSEFPDKRLHTNKTSFTQRKCAAHK